jgi:hypothetical protein
LSCLWKNSLGAEAADRQNFEVGVTELNRSIHQTFFPEPPKCGLSSDAGPFLVASTMDRTVEREGERDAQLTFTRLKPLCSQLLDVSSTSPEARETVLDTLLKVLQAVPAAGLQRCIEYVHENHQTVLIQFCSCKFRSFFCF